jgi:hypothetical protein
VRFPDPPFAYRLEHRRGDAAAVLARAPTYAAVVAEVLPCAARLRAAGAEGELAVVEEAFGTVVARHPLWPADAPFAAHHERPPER